MVKRETPRWIEAAILPYVRDPMLWPVLLVVIAHVVVGIAPLLLLALRDGSQGAGTTLLLLGAASLAGVGLELRGRRRPGAFTAIVLATWLASLATAWLADRHGLF